MATLPLGTRRVTLTAVTMSATEIAQVIQLLIDSTVAETNPRIAMSVNTRHHISVKTRSVLSNAG